MVTFLEGRRLHTTTNNKLAHIPHKWDRNMLYLYRTLNCTSPDQREYGTYAKRRFEGSMGVQTVVSDSNPL